MVKEERMGKVEILETFREGRTTMICGRRLCRRERLNSNWKRFRSKGAGP